MQWSFPPSPSRELAPVDPGPLTAAVQAAVPRIGLRLLAAAAVAASFYLALGAVPLFDPDEGAFGAATLEMFQRHDFLSVFLAGEPRYDKPILIYWLQAVAVSLLGVNEWAFRLPSAIAASLWIGLTYRFGREWFNERVGLLAAVMLACAPSVQIVARAATADALLNACLAASMFAIYHYLARGGRTQLYVAAAAAGLGFLAKGPIAILIPAAVTLLFCLIRRDIRVWLGLASDWRAWLVFLFVGPPWYLVEYLRDGPAFLEGFFLGHNIGRYAGPSFGHGGAWWFYVPVVLAGTLPFTAPLAGVLGRIRGMFRDDLSAFLMLWFAFVIVFFSLAGSQQSHYANYGYTGIFLLMAARATTMTSRAILLPALAVFGLLGALPLTLEVLAPRIGNPYLREILADSAGLFGPGYVVYFAAAAAGALVWMVRPFAAAPAALAASGAALAVGVATCMLPVAAALQQAPVVAAARIAARDDLRVVMWRINAPSFMVYAGRTVERRAPRPCDVVLTRSGVLPELPEHELIFRQHAVALARLNC
jgi:4-amino-4-deoxy-L-arabinose transferase-like glycosyltransferase